MSQVVLAPAFLPFALPDTGEDELAEIAEVVRSGWVTTGPKTRKFEAEFAAYVGATHSIAVNSCTAAMHLALDAAGVGSDDEVITTPYTFAATGEVIRYMGARPVFVDVEPDTLNLDPALLEAAVSERTKAIIPVHMAGLAADLDAIHTVARKHGLRVIEDAAHALPTTYKQKRIGALSDFTCFSFYASKPLCTGEGGMLCTEDESLAERSRIMSLHGISRDAWKRYTADGSWYYDILAPGFKYNLTDIASAMGLAQLRKLERLWARRRDIALEYTEAFSDCAELECPAEPGPWDTHAWHLYMLRLNLEHLTIDRAQFIQELRDANIGVSVHFIPLHVHPYYRETYGYRPEDWPVAFREYQREVSLPIYSRMEDADVDRVIQTVTTIVQRHAR